MLEKIKTGTWFLKRPSHWSQAFALFQRRFQPNKDSEAHHKEATTWASERAVSIKDALTNIGLMKKGDNPPAISQDILNEGEERAEKSPIAMGGPGDLQLLYAAVALSKPDRIVETGVAYGWSSLSILSAMQGNANAKLVSVDMPYPKMNNEAFVGIVVPEVFRNNWEIIREPDRKGLEKAIEKLGGEIDFCHYDSDKSWYGRQYGFYHLWKALKSGGVFISDDIQDNMAFAEFVNDIDVPFAITEADGKFVGILLKP